MGSLYPPTFCTLCEKSSTVFFKDPKTKWDYFLCPVCDLRFKNPQQRLNPQEERERYLLHESGVGQEGYAKFTQPMIDQIQKRIPTGSQGLDFGCGPDSAVTAKLRSFGYKMTLYDSFFVPDQSALLKKYDFIVAVEVIEHLYTPAKVFADLHGALKVGAQMAVMTHIFAEDTDFPSWYYRRDPTHVCFYSEKTLNWIQKTYGFKSYAVLTDRLVWFST